MQGSSCALLPLLVSKPHERAHFALDGVVALLRGLHPNSSEFALEHFGDLAQRRNLSIAAPTRTESANLLLDVVHHPVRLVNDAPVRIRDSVLERLHEPSQGGVLPERVSA